MAKSFQRVQVVGNPIDIKYKERTYGNLVVARLLDATLIITFKIINVRLQHDVDIFTLFIFYIQ